MKKIRLKTSDGIEIVGIFRSSDPSSGSLPTQTPACRQAGSPSGRGGKTRKGGGRAAILLHMMPATKESWDVFAFELDRAGFASLAIDERGHGESTMNGTLDYHVFTEEQQQAKIQDVEAARVYLQSQGFVDAEIVLVGASIGANLSIQFLSEHPNIMTAVALSPGLNYRGVKTDGFIKQLHTGQQVILVSSDDDDRDSAQSCRLLHQINPTQTVLVEKKGLGHGTTMFEKEPELMGEVIKLMSIGSRRL